MTLDNSLPIIEVPFFCDYCQCWIDQLPHNHATPPSLLLKTRRRQAPCKKDGRSVFSILLSSGDIIQFPYYLYHRYTFIRMLVNDALYNSPTHEFLVPLPPKKA